MSQQTNPVPPPESEKKGIGAAGLALGAIGIVAALVLVMCIVAIVVIAILTLLGPQVANVFSKITNGLSAP